MGHRRLASLVLAAVLVAGILSVSAGASDTQGRPAGSPDLAAMSLGLGDFPTGARLVRQRYYRDPDFVASYEREFSLGGTQVGRSSLFFVFTGLDVDQTAQGATETFAAAKALFRSKRFRDAFAREIAREADLTAKSVVIARPRAPRIGDGAIVLGITLRERGVPFHLTVTLMRVDRVLGSIVLVGLPGRKLYAADADRLARTSADRMRAGLVPAVSGPPLVTGVLNPGQTLSATQGTWTGDQVAFSYQWERCTEPETGCTPIPGATASTYALTTTDLASTVRVSVTGRNRLGTATASSANTGFVAGPPGAPVATAAPTFDAVVGSGATLTATTGTWTGSPTAFAYQWRRCSPTTGACVDVAGATGETYTLSVADSGSLIRLLVVATNASGSGGALSPPSRPAP